MNECVCIKPDPPKDASGRVKGNICASCGRQIPTQRGMKVRKASWPCSYIIPANPKNGQPKDKEVRYVGTKLAVLVEDLEGWLRKNPEVKAIELAELLAKGEFR